MIGGTCLDAKLTS